MKQMVLIIFIALVFIMPAKGFSDERSESLPKWLALLEKGNSKEKQLALRNLWFLEYPEFRKDIKVFNPIIDALLKDKDPSVREAAANLLKRIGEYSKGCCQDMEIVPSLIKALGDSSTHVRAEAAKALAYYKDKRAIAPLIKALKDKALLVRLNAAFSLGELKDREALTPLAELLMDDSDWRNKFVQQECVIAIGKIGVLNKEAFSALIRRSNDPYLKTDITKTLNPLYNFKVSEEDSAGILAAVEELTQSPDENIRRLALETLSRMFFKDDNLKLRFFIRSRKDPSPAVRVVSIRELGKRRLDKVIELLLEAVNDTDEMVRAEVTRALGLIGDKRAVEPLLKAIKDKSKRVRAAAAEGLGWIGDERAVDPLLEALNDPSAVIREKVIKALGGFKNEKILDAMAPFLGKIGDGKSIPDPAGMTFLSVAQRTFKERVYVTRKDGNRSVLKDRPIGVPAWELMIHPSAADILIERLKDSDPAVRLSVLYIFNFEDSRIEPYLIKFLDDPSSQIRQRAISRIMLFGRDTIVPKLIEALNDKDNGVRVMTVTALGAFQNKRAIEPLVGKLKDSDSSMREAVLNSILTFDDPKILDLLIELLKDDSASVRSLVIKYINKKPDKRAIEPLILFLKNPDVTVRRAALESLGNFDDPRVSDINISMLSDDSLYGIAVMNVKKRPDKRAVEQLIYLLRDHKNSKNLVSFYVAETLGIIGDTRALDPLIAALRGEYGNDPGNVTQMRVKAAEALGLLKNKKAVPALIEVIKDPNEWLALRQASLKALGEIGDSSALDTIQTLLNDKQFPFNSTLEALAGIKDDRATAIFIERLNSSDFSIVNPAILLLRKQKNISAVKPLVKTVGKNSVYAFNVSQTLREYKDPEMVNILTEYLKDKDDEVRKGAIILLGGGWGDTVVIEQLKALLEDPEVKKEALSAIRRLETPLQHHAKVTTMPLVPTKRPEFSAGYGGVGGYEDIGGGTATIDTYQPRVVIKPFTGDVKWLDEKIVITQRKPVDIGPILVKLKNKDPKIRREAADALGNIGDNKATKHLIPLLKDKNEYVRQAAARALRKLNDKEAVEPLIETLKDPDTNVLAFTIWALGEIKDPRAAEPLAPLLLSKDTKTSERVFEAMRKLQDPASKKIMVNTLMKAREEWMLQRLISLEGEAVVLKTFEDPGGDKIKTIRNYINLMAGGNNAASGIASKALRNDKDRELVISEAADRIKNGSKDASIYIGFLGSLNDRSVLPILIEALKDRKGIDRYSAIEAIGKLGGYKEIEGMLMEILANPNEGGIRAHAARALGKLGDKKAVDTLIKIAQDDQEIRDIKIGVIAALGDIKDKKAIEPLTKIIKNTQNDVWLRVAAVSSLGDIGDESAIGVIQDAASNDSTGYIKGAADTALRKIKTGK